MNHAPLRFAPFDRAGLFASQKRRRGLRPGLESLEGRALLTATLSEFPTPVSNPTAITTGPDGNLWVLASDSNGNGAVDVFGVDGSFLHTYSIPTPNPGASALTVGPDGNVWFTETYADKIGKVTPDGIFTEYAVPNATGGNASVDPTNPSGTDGVEAAPTSIVAGKDGALWFTDSSSDAIGRITTDGTITQYPTPGLQPNSLTVGPDGAIWFTDNSFSNTIDRLNLDGNGNATFSEFPLPENFSMPTGLTTGPDGALWFAESGNDAIGRITTGGAVTEWPILGNFNSPEALTFDASGNLWVAGYGGGLARLTPRGQTLIVGLQPASDLNASAITTSPDGSIWFTDATNNLVGRIDPTTVATLPTDNTLGVDPQQATTPDVENGLTFTDTLASFTAGNPAAAVSDFSAQINWGDGSTSSGTVALVSPGQFDVSGTHAYAGFGTYAASVTVTDTNLAQTPQPNILTMPISIEDLDQPVPVLSVGGPTPIGVPVDITGSTGLGGSGAQGSPGAQSLGGTGTTPVVVSRTPTIVGPTSAQLFMAGYVNPWFTAARQFQASTASTRVAPQAVVHKVATPAVKGLRHASTPKKGLPTPISHHVPAATIHDRIAPAVKPVPKTSPLKTRSRFFPAN